MLNPIAAASVAARPTHIFRPPIRAGPYVGFLELWVPTIRAFGRTQWNSEGMDRIIQPDEWNLDGGAPCRRDRSLKSSPGDCVRLAGQANSPELRQKLFD